MMGIVTFTAENDNYRVYMDLPKGCNLKMIHKGMERLMQDPKDFQLDIDADGLTTSRYQAFLQVSPEQATEHKYLCLECGRNPVDADNGQTMCDTCLNEPAPTY